MGLGQGAASVERLREEIVSVRYREATTTFCRLVKEEDRPLKDMIKAAIASAATADPRCSIRIWKSAESGRPWPWAIACGRWSWVQRTA